MTGKRISKGQSKVMLKEHCAKAQSIFGSVLA